MRRRVSAETSARTPVNSDVMFKSATILPLVLILAACMDNSNWQHVEIDTLKKSARAQNKQILVYFSMEHCQPCRVLEKDLENPQISAQIEEMFVTSKIEMELKRTTVEDRYKVKFAPTLLALDADANELDRLMGYSWHYTNVGKGNLGQTKIESWLHNLPLKVPHGTLSDQGTP